MGDALALEDLGAVLLWAGAFILASLAYYIGKAVEGAVDVDILGHHPFRGIAHAIEGAIVSPMDSLRQKSEAGIAKGLSGLLDSLAILVGLTVLLGEGVKAALTYLWHHALAPFVHGITDTIRDTANRAESEAKAAEHQAELAYSRAVAYVNTELARAKSEAESYAAGKAIAAQHAAEAFADTAVAKLRAAEDTAVAHAVSIANEAKAAGIAAAHAAEAAAEQSARAQLAAAESAFNQSLAAVKSVAITAEGELRTIEGTLGATGVAALLAAIPALATLVHAIATEAGLDSAACRGKVGQVCGTDPAQWTRLLGGLGLLGFLLDFPELVKIARPFVAEGADLIREVA